MCQGDHFGSTVNREFVYMTDFLEGYEDIQLAILFDLDENGSFDILMVQHNKEADRNEIIAIVNNNKKESFFIKSKIINSVYQKGETLYNGCTIRAVLTDLDDEKYIAVGQQVTQNSYGTLSLPYSYIGIGRSNNYIERFTVGIMIEGKLKIRTWSPIIPNSQLVVAIEGSSDPAYWGLELMTNPIQEIGIIVVVDILFLAVLGLVILILHFKETADDAKQQLDIFEYF